ncbi:two-component system sensor kinase protein [Corynebacterium diphtheriae bv. mitis]|nr:hypothetical protein AO271_09620 [Corynebacterium diphtheriae]SUY76674.1 two-component system sensor kinase protein [Corynebacterium diphtheriae bv. mitis]
MKRTLLPTAALGVSVLLSACSSQNAPSSNEASATPAPADPAVVHDSALPFDALPMPPQGREGFEECPYLDSQWVADTNGQRMTGQGVDTRFDTPACVFWSYPEAPQATVMVRHMPSEEEAIRVVDWAAPIDTTEPAEEPEGWSGGRAGHEEGAVYAVQKGPVAVVVWSNQQQSLKAELMAKEAIARLGL